MCIAPEIIPGKELFRHKATFRLDNQEVLLTGSCSACHLKQLPSLHCPFYFALKGPSRFRRQDVGRDNSCCADTEQRGLQDFLESKTFSSHLGPFVISKVGADRWSGTSFMSPG